jgi:TPR repeat protein
VCNTTRNGSGFTDTFNLQVEAKINLANMYVEGRGVPHDTDKARVLYAECSEKSQLACSLLAALDESKHPLLQQAHTQTDVYIHRPS